MDLQVDVPNDGANQTHPHRPTLIDQAAYTGFDFGAGACIIVTIEDAGPHLPFPPTKREFLFFNDPRTGDMRSAGRRGDIVATVAAALSEANGSPRPARRASWSTPGQNLRARTSSSPSAPRR